MPSRSPRRNAASGHEVVSDEARRRLQPARCRVEHVCGVEKRVALVLHRVDVATRRGEARAYGEVEVAAEAVGGGEDERTDTDRDHGQVFARRVPRLMHALCG